MTRENGAAVERVRVALAGGVVPAGALDAFRRNGRWGTCIDCPWDDIGMRRPERCVNTERHDHHLRGDAPTDADVRALLSAHDDAVASHAALAAAVLAEREAREDAEDAKNEAIDAPDFYWTAKAIAEANARRYDTRAVHDAARAALDSILTRLV